MLCHLFIVAITAGLGVTSLLLPLVPVANAMDTVSLKSPAFEPSTMFWGLSTRNSLAGVVSFRDKPLCERP